MNFHFHELLVHELLLNLISSWTFHRLNFEVHELASFYKILNELNQTQNNNNKIRWGHWAGGLVDPCWTACFTINSIDICLVSCSMHILVTFFMKYSHWYILSPIGWCLKRDGLYWSKKFAGNLEFFKKTKISSGLQIYIICHFRC